MSKIIRFSKYFVFAAVFSVLIVASFVFGYIMHGGFALGVDFQAGLIQEVQIAPTAFSLRWYGVSSATLSFDRSNLYIVVTGSGIEGRTHSFSFTEYATIGSLTRAMEQQLEELEVSMTANTGINSQWLIFSSLGDPYLNNETPYIIHYLDPQSPPIDISEVRNSMAGFGQGISVQSLGIPSERRFMIRVEDQDEGRITSDDVTQFLEAYFGIGGVAVLRSDYVGSRFSRDLTDQAVVLISLTLLLILLYSTIRFKLQYAAGAVLAIMHDAVVIITFIIWSRMEFNTITIAALLTILGYSINNTIIFFDRVRDNLRIYPDHSFLDILDISQTDILSRTIITTLTTMLAVLSLFIFTSGSMKDFALALLIGLTSGVYTTLFIVPGFVYFWEKRKSKKAKKKLAAA